MLKLKDWHDINTLYILEYICKDNFKCNYESKMTRMGEIELLIMMINQLEFTSEMIDKLESV